MSKVLIADADYTTVGEAVDQAFDVFPLDVAGKRVLIKPNVLRASKANEGIVTHPAVLRAVVAKVAAMQPAELIVGDNPGLFSYGANEASFEETGLMDAAQGYYQNIGNESVQVAFNPDFMPFVSVSRAVLDADVIISLPKFKTHGLTVMSGAIKNSYGFLPGGQKARLHKAAGDPERFHNLVVEVFQLRGPDFFVVDAVVGMEGNGPASPDLRDVGKILASDNAVALDGVIAAMMGLDPGRLAFLNKATACGLGDYDLDRIDVIGALDPISDYKLPPLGGQAIMDNEAIQDFIQARGSVQPAVDQDLCTACETCVEQCPVSALEMIDDFPRAEEAPCLTCVCCQEICPDKAIALR
mgnify:CR=1 FL=1